MWEEGGGEECGGVGRGRETGVQRSGMREEERSVEGVGRGRGREDVGRERGREEGK